MTTDSERLVGYADALHAIECLIEHLLHSTGSTQARPGLEVALAAVRETRASAGEYCDHLRDVREQYEAEWGHWAEPEQECIPCLAEMAPHTCLPA